MINKSPDLQQYVTISTSTRNWLGFCIIDTTEIGIVVCEAQAQDEGIQLPQDIYISLARFMTKSISIMTILFYHILFHDGWIYHEDFTAISSSHLRSR